MPSGTWWRRRARDSHWHGRRPGNRKDAPRALANRRSDRKGADGAAEKHPGGTDPYDLVGVMAMKKR